MRVHTQPFVPARAAAAILAASTLFLGAHTAGAAVINYGNFNAPPSTVVFQNVTESSGTDPIPLYGPPSAFAVGLDFDPTNFVASSTNGANDITDGQLNFTITSNPSGSAAINSLSIFESGDYSLIGPGTTLTRVLAGVIGRVTVLEVNGAPVTPFNLGPSNASVSFNVVSNPGVVQPWSLGTSVNILGQLPTFGYPATAVATKVEVVIDNDLFAGSETNSFAVIAKKDFRVDVLTVARGDVPEPATLSLLGLGALGLVARRRR